MGNDLRELRRQAQSRKFREDMELQKLKDSQSSNTILAILIILAIIGLGYLIYIFSSPASRDHKCAWCGKTEPCDSYCVQTIEGYNADGSIKFGVDIVYIGDKCYPDALENGMEKGWINIKER